MKQKQRTETDKEKVMKALEDEEVFRAVNVYGHSEVSYLPRPEISKDYLNTRRSTYIKFK